MQVDLASQRYSNISEEQRDWKRWSVGLTATTGAAAAISNETDLGLWGTIGSILLGGIATYVANEAGSNERKNRAEACKTVSKAGDSVVELYRNHWKLRALSYPADPTEQQRFNTELLAATDELNREVQQYREECP
jgi:hypothetical protein